MKKTLALLLTVLFLFTTVSVFSASAKETYTVEVSDHIGISNETETAAGTAVVFDKLTVAADHAASCTLSLAVVVKASTPVSILHAFVNGKQDDSILKYNYFADGNCNTVFLTLNEGKYDSVLLRATDKNGNEMDAVLYTDLTVTAAVGGSDDSGVPVEYTPVWQLSAKDIPNAPTIKRCSISYNENGYATFTGGKEGDPCGQYLSDTETRIGRYLLIKYNNHTVIPRMQIYIAQQGGIKSDVNMLEFDISANRSGWTYVIVDLATNAQFNKDTQSVYYFRYDPLEARNVNGGAYKFDGTETIDVAYIKGFTTRKGLEGWLNENELHPVHKTAVLNKSQLTKTDAGMTFTDEHGKTHACTENADGTWGYEFDAQDVRTPVKAVPVTLLDGSALKGSAHSSVEAAFDREKGFATLTVTGADPHHMLSNSEMQAARYMAVRYRTAHTGDKTEFFMSSANPAPAAGDSFKFDTVSDGEWHTQIIDLAACGISSLNTDTWKLNYLRMDVFDAASEGTMDIEYIAFFDSEDAAIQYDHVYTYFTATFVASNVIVEKVYFETGATAIAEPAVPEKEGYTGAWAPYTLENRNITVKAVYTVADVATDPETQPATEPETNPETEPATVSDTEPEAVPETAPAQTDTQPAATDADTAPGTTDATTADPVDGTTSETDTQPASGGCTSLLGSGTVALLLMAVAAVFVRRKD